MKTTQDIINDSGYPLQIHLEKWIEETRKYHKWQVLVREHRWVNTETGDEGFIDLVLEHASYNMRLVVECKRILGNWTFLLPSMNPNIEHKVRILCADYKTYKLTWDDSNMTPDSYEAAYCVMETDGKKDTRTLEKFSGELLLSSEYLAKENTELIKLLQEQSKMPVVNTSQQAMLYLPIIVTTATLQKLTFDPSNIDIKNGKINESNTGPIEFIRFRKNLATNIKNIKHEESSLYTLRELNRENDRTVFIVQAENLINFLSRIDF